MLSADMDAASPVPILQQASISAYATPTPPSERLSSLLRGRALVTSFSFSSRHHGRSFRPSLSLLMHITAGQVEIAFSRFLHDFDAASSSA